MKLTPRVSGNCVTCDASETCGSLSRQKHIHIEVEANGTWLCVEWGSTNTTGTSMFMVTKISTHIEV